MCWNIAWICIVAYIYLLYIFTFVLLISLTICFKLKSWIVKLVVSQISARLINSSYCVVFVQALQAGNTCPDKRTRNSFLWKIIIMFPKLHLWGTYFFPSSNYLINIKYFDLATTTILFSLLVGKERMFISHSTLSFFFTMGGRQQCLCFPSFTWLKWGSRSVETVCTRQISFRFVAVASQKKPWEVSVYLKEDRGRTVQWQ